MQRRRRGARRTAGRDRARARGSPSERAAIAVMRPSWPPPRMPIVAPGRMGSSALTRELSVSPSTSSRARRAPRAQPLAHLGVARARRSAPRAAPRWPRRACRWPASRPARPSGICTIESSASTPLSTVAGTGTPSTGTSVFAATMPGRCAAPPAPAMITCSPRASAVAAYSNIQSGVRCAETTRTSCGTPSSASSSRAGASCS